jgi:hypothetical protein
MSESNFSLKFQTSINFEEDGFIIHNFIGNSNFPTEMEVKITYQEAINYNLESCLIYPNTEKEKLDPDSFEGKAILEEVEYLKKFVKDYEDRVSNAINNYNK